MAPSGDVALQSEEQNTKQTYGIDSVRFCQAMTERSLIPRERRCVEK